jgi:hypothetical protein
MMSVMTVSMDKQSRGAHTVNKYGLLDPAAAGWSRLFYFPPWEVYLVKRPNKSGWCELCVRLQDATASKRSWWLYWSLPEQRLAKSAYSNDLARRHPDVPQQLKFRLRDWHPQW